MNEGDFLTVTFLLLIEVNINVSSCCELLLGEKITTNDSLCECKTCHELDQLCCVESMPCKIMERENCLTFLLLFYL
jgi:hypothetical protein